MTASRTARVVRRLAELLRNQAERREFMLRRKHRLVARCAALHKTSLLRARKLVRGSQTYIAIGLVEHMGDIVAAEPIVRQLRLDNPEAHIVWFVRAPFRDVRELLPHVSQVRVVSCLTEWIHLRQGRFFDKILDLHTTPRQCPVCCIKLTRSEGNLEINLRNYYHHGNLLQIMLQYTDVAAADHQPRLDIPERVHASVDLLALPARYLAIHCAASEAARNWHKDGWHDLVAAVRSEFDIGIVELGLSPVVAGTAANGVIDLCGRLTIPQLADVIRRAAVFVGVDSGPAHVANAVGTPGVILLGPYHHFGRYMPFSGAYESGENATLVYEPSGLQNLPASAAFAAVKKWLEASRDGASAAT